MLGIKGMGKQPPAASAIGEMIRAREALPGVRAAAERSRWRDKGEEAIGHRQGDCKPSERRPARENSAVVLGEVRRDEHTGQEDPESAVRVGRGLGSDVVVFVEKDSQDWLNETGGRGRPPSPSSPPARGRPGSTNSSTMDPASGGERDGEEPGAVEPAERENVCGWCDVRGVEDEEEEKSGGGDHVVEAADGAAEEAAEGVAHGGESRDRWKRRRRRKLKGDMGAHNRSRSRIIESVL
jgi:hypothetical protein